MTLLDALKAWCEGKQRFSDDDAILYIRVLWLNRWSMILQFFGALGVVVDLLGRQLCT